MKILDRYIASSVTLATLVVVLVIVALDAVFALVAEVDDLRGGYQIIEALQYIAMRLPRRVYEYMPMACLIGCLVGLGSLAASSELTVMRAAGISVARIALSVLKPTAILMLISLLNAEYAVPYLERQAESLKTVAQGRNEISSNSGRGYWHREGNEYTRFAAADPNGVLYNLTLYSFDEDHILQRVRYAKKAHYRGEGVWQLDNTQELILGDSANQLQQLGNQATWKSELTPNTLNVVIFDPRDMSISDLYAYASYLQREKLNANEYLLSFWAKVNQPLGTFALVILGISFIFGPLRSVTPGFRIFSGVMVGLLYKYSEELLGPISMILGAPPLMATLVPTAICFLAGWRMMRKVG